MSEASLYDDLQVIREAAQLLATRFSMIAAPLNEAAEAFWSVIHNDDVGEWPEPLRTQAAELAVELSADGDRDDVSAEVGDVDGFDADALIGRILDLRKEMQELCPHEVA